MEHGGRQSDTNPESAHTAPHVTDRVLSSLNFTRIKHVLMPVINLNWNTFLFQSSKFLGDSCMHSACSHVIITEAEES